MLDNTIKVIQKFNELLFKDNNFEINLQLRILN